MKEKRDTYKYHFKVGNKIVHGGITDRQLEEREQEHQSSGKISANRQKKYDWSKGHIVKVGKRTTRKAALKWERENGFGANQKRNC